MSILNTLSNLAKLFTRTPVKDKVDESQLSVQLPSDLNEAPNIEGKSLINERTSNSRMDSEKESQNISDTLSDEKTLNSTYQTKKTENGLENPKVDLRYLRKQIRRKITADFEILLKLGNQCSSQQISEFIFKYHLNLDLLREAMSQHKHSENLAAILLWSYLDDEASTSLDQIILEQKIKAERQTWFDTKLLEPIIINVNCVEIGPKFEEASIEKITQIIRSFFYDTNLNINVRTDLEINQLGEYKLSIELSTGEIFRRTLILQPKYNEIRTENLVEITKLPPISQNEIGDPIEWLQTLLTEQTSNDFSQNFQGITRFLATAFHSGYWLIPWIQEIYQDWQSQLEIIKQNLDGADQLSTILNKILDVPHLYSNGIIESEIIKRIRASTNLVKRDLARIKTINNIATPSKLSQLVKLTTSWRTNLTDKDISNQFLVTAFTYIHQVQDSLAKYCIAEYCFYKGKLLYYDKPSEARSYLYVFLLLHGQLPIQAQHELVDHLYWGLTYYFYTFNLIIPRPVNSAQNIDWFYPALYKMLQERRKQQIELGFSLVGIATCSQGWMLDLINRMKNRTELNALLNIIASAIREPSVFRSEPYHSSQLLSRIDPSSISLALSRQAFSTSEQRRLVAIGILRLANNSISIDDKIVGDLSSHASNDTVSALGFSILVEPFMFNNPDKESQLKARILVETYGFPTGTKPTELFQGRMKEIATLFDRFYRTQDQNIKGRFGTTIQDTIRVTRRYLIENIPNTRADLVILLFRRLEAHVTAELAKLIHDTQLEIAIVNDRALYISNSTRIIVEIRNVGEGIADGLELEVFPVESQYMVDDIHRMQTLESLPERAVEQREVFIAPQVDVNSNIELNITLRYNTLKQKGMETRLNQSRKTVWLYPETEFIRVAQVYNITEPATTWFYGRRDMLQSMADNLSNEPGDLGHNTSMIVYGLKRAGKTSVVKRFITHTLRERRLDDLYIPVYLDFLKDVQIEDIKGDSDFLFLLIETLGRALSPEKRSLIFNDPQILGRFTTAPQKEFTFLLEKILSLLDRRRILLVLDEFSQLKELLENPTKGTGLSSRMFGFLSNTMQSTNQLVFVFTGTYVLNGMMREHAFDLAKICMPKLISFLDDNSARRLVTEPLAQDKNRPERGYLQFHGDVVDRIVQVTNRHPYLIQYICKLLVERINSEIKHPRVNLNDIDTIIHDVITKPSHDPAFLSFWNDFDATQRKILAIVAEGRKRNPSQPWVTINDISDVFRSLRSPISLEDVLRLCTSLEDAEMLERSPGDEAYRISIPLYQNWLSQNRSVVMLFEQAPSS